MNAEPILNLEYNKKVLLIKALNKAKDRKAAAMLLGISERMLYNYILEYGVEKQKGEYVTKTKKHYNASEAYQLV